MLILQILCGLGWATNFGASFMLATCRTKLALALFLVANTLMLPLMIWNHEWWIMLQLATYQGFNVWGLWNRYKRSPVPWNHQL